MVMWKYVFPELQFEIFVKGYVVKISCGQRMNTRSLYDDHYKDNTTMKKAHTHLVLGVDQTDSMFVDGYEEDLGEVWLSGLLHWQDFIKTLCFVSWRNTCALYNGFVGVLPSLQRMQNQTWAIWKGSSETSAWLPLSIYQHVCWSTPLSTAKPFKSNIFWVNATKGTFEKMSKRNIVFKNKPSSSRPVRAGVSDPEE